MNYDTDPSMNNSNALSEAARLGRIDMIKLFIEYGADSYEAYPIAAHYARRVGCSQISDLLIEAVDESLQRREEDDVFDLVIRDRFMCELLF